MNDMTNKLIRDSQIEHLQNIIGSEQAEDTPSELDYRVFAAARAHAAGEQRKTTRSHQQLTDLFESFGALSGTALAGFLTLAVIMGVEKVMTPPEPEIAVVWTQTPAAQQAGSLISMPEKPDALKQVERQQRPQNQHLPNQNLNGEVLASASLPRVGELMDRIPTAQIGNRTATELAIGNALADINWLIRSGEYNDARDRYQQLRRDCTDCPLPDSLEALATLADSTPDQG